jgi:cyanophycin synthetase
MALDQATPASLVVILPESVSRAISLLEARNPLPERISGSIATDAKMTVMRSVVNKV